MDLIGSKTEANLRAALWGEAKAYAEYSIFSEKAASDAYPQVAHIFSEMALTEKEHYKSILEVLLAKMPSTEENLKDSIESEDFEWKQLYKKCTMEAEEEGFYSVAELFCDIAIAEREHEAILRTLLTGIHKKPPEDDDAFPDNAEI